MVDANRVPSALTNRNLENCSFKKFKVNFQQNNSQRNLEPAQKLFINITLKLCMFFLFKLYDKTYTCGDVQKAELEEFYW